MIKYQILIIITLFGLLIASLTRLPFRISTRKEYRYHYEQKIN